MTDLEITRLCAEAMGYKRDDHKHHIRVFIGAYVFDYDPLNDDAQAMQLVKKKGLSCIFELGQGRESWNVQHWRDGIARNADLNRAICLCVAKMMQAKRG